eukprot:CAMPEP_0119317532 /NCGR_PEP_ID=MMETSP1333-20130426/43404_1 /TAXON_ID=418940 /ORGANISM="Scyphosphaera apsteinii, Strain RCC1455" /LENGTH=335 /DNA_ID=CAMNT_0007323485 /DNA_START=575 /DNA_END=1585 /DNA_ORIENTATION=-
MTNEIALLTDELDVLSSVSFVVPGAVYAGAGRSMSADSSAEAGSRFCSSHRAPDIFVSMACTRCQLRLTEVAVARLDKLAHVAELLVEQPTPETGYDQRFRRFWRETSFCLLNDHIQGLLPSPRVPEAPELAAVAIAFAQEGDGIVEKPVSEELRSTATHIKSLLPELTVQLFEGVIILVVNPLQLLRQQFMSVNVQRLQKGLLQCNRGAQVAIVLVAILRAHHVDCSPPLHRVLRNCAKLNENSAYPGAERDFERVRHSESLDDASMHDCWPGRGATELKSTTLESASSHLASIGRQQPSMPRRIGMDFPLLLAKAWAVSSAPTALSQMRASAM